jgi:hypothetical protein
METGVTALVEAQIYSPVYPETSLYAEIKAKRPDTPKILNLRRL